MLQRVVHKPMAWVWMAWAAGVLAHSAHAETLTCPMVHIDASAEKTMVFLSDPPHGIGLYRYVLVSGKKHAGLLDGQALAIQAGGGYVSPLREGWLHVVTAGSEVESLGRFRAAVDDSKGGAFGQKPDLDLPMEPGRLDGLPAGAVVCSQQL